MTLKKQKQKSIATRARMLYAYLPVITSLILLIVVIIVANGIANVHASRIARQYSIEAAGNFQAHIDPHFTLMMQLSRSTTIARWMSDDTNELLTDHAFEEIIGFATYAPTSRFMFTSYETFNIYDFLPGATDWLTRETFTSLGQLIPGPEAQWFFQTRDWDLFFNFNIQREMDVQGLDPDTLQMWLNQRVYYQGGFVGVVAIGIPFRYVFEPTFGGFVAGEMRGYILDHNGEVRADSAWELDVFEDGLPTFLPMPESLDNPNLAEHVQRHLAQRVGGIYQLGAHTFAAVPLSRGMYSYASIAPIIGTDWSIAVLSYHTGIFGFQYAPVVFLFVGMMMFSIIIGSVLTRRIVIDPLFELTKSVAKVDTLKNAKIYGMDRDDEFGKLANAIYTAKQEAAKAHEERQRLEVAEESSRAKSKFLAKMSHEIRTPITAVMGISEIHLKQKGLDAPIEDSFAKIYNSSNLLLNIVNDILDISKIESGHMTLMEDEYEISSVIVGACHRSTVYYGDKGIDFKLDVDENLPATL
ncbi:MAG: hypothetical protein FWB74_02900, partial [Defluviitaleaceae bacterium]|nr:hypothetical protein [Defluviitaleaceae bacterium]